MSSNIIDWTDKLAQFSREGRRGGGPAGPDGPDMTDLERRVTRIETKLDVVLPTLATKTDLAELKAILIETRAMLPTLAKDKDLAEVKTTLPTLATKAEMAETRSIIPTLATKAELHDMKSDLQRWMIGTMFASAGLALSIGFGLVKLFPGAPAAPGAPPAITIVLTPEAVRAALPQAGPAPGAPKQP